MPIPDDLAILGQHYMMALDWLLKQKPNLFVPSVMFMGVMLASMIKISDKSIHQKLRDAVVINIDKELAAPPPPPLN